MRKNEKNEMIKGDTKKKKDYEEKEKKKEGKNMEAEKFEEWG